MNDAHRNEMFAAALQEVVDQNSVVLDIGAGSGLLSMIAGWHQPNTPCDTRRALPGQEPSATS